MSEIEVGEYVRTDNGEIHKVIDIEKGSIKIKSQYKEWIGLCCIANHSKQLIDLIEVGDFVNGHRIFCKIHGEIGEKDIETILTKEQYLANCYKVGGEDE